MRDDSAKKEISVTKSVEEAWAIMLSNLPAILLLLAVSIAILFLLAILLGLYSELLSTPLLGSKIARFVAKELISTVGVIAVATTSLKLADGQKIHIRDLFSRQGLFFHVLVAEFLYGALVLIGLLLFIVPGLIFAIRFSLYDLHLVDTGCGPIVALQKSWETVKGYSWRLVGFYLLSCLILLLGLLFFGIGLLLAWPTVVIARTLLFRKLSGERQLLLEK